MKARVYVSNVFTTRHAKEKKNKELDRTLTKPSSLYPIQENKEKGKSRKSMHIKPYMLGRVSYNMVDKLIVLDYIVLRFRKASHVNETS